MWKKLGYVALTYYSPKRAVSAVAVAIWLTIMWQVVDSPPSVILPSFFLSIVAFSVGGLEFARPQARLIPGYAIPQIIYLVAILVVGCVLLPALFAQRAGLSMTGALALATLPPVLLKWNVGAWLLVAMMFIPLKGWGNEFWLLLDAKYAVWHLLIILVGWVAIGSRLYALTRQEENPEGLLTAYGSFSDPSSYTARKQRRAIESIRTKGLKASLSDWWHNRIGRNPPTTLFGRVQLLRYGTSAVPTVASATIVPLAILLYISVVEFLFSHGDESFADNLASFSYLAFLAAIFFPAAIAATRLSERQARMGSELLWPFSKRTYIDTLVLAAVCEGAIWWVALHAFAAGTIFNSPDSEFSMSLIASYLILNLSFQILLFGAFLLLALCDSTVIRIIVMVPLVAFPLAVIIYWWEDRRHTGDTPFVACALFGAVIGAFCIQSARIAWRDVEVK